MNEENGENILAEYMSIFPLHQPPFYGLFVPAPGSAEHSVGIVLAVSEFSGNRFWSPRKINLQEMHSFKILKKVEMAPDLVHLINILEEDIDIVSRAVTALEQNCAFHEPLFRFNHDTRIRRNHKACIGRPLH